MPLITNMTPGARAISEAPSSTTTARFTTSSNIPWMLPKITSTSLVRKPRTVLLLCSRCQAKGFCNTAANTCSPRSAAIRALSRSWIRIVSTRSRLLTITTSMKPSPRPSSRCCCGSERSGNARGPRALRPSVGLARRRRNGSRAPRFATSPAAARRLRICRPSSCWRRRGVRASQRGLRLRSFLVGKAVSLIGTRG